MATTAEKKILRSKLEKYEGRIEYLYEDSLGNVTVGVGHLIKNVSSAQKLDFIYKSNGAKATSEDIKKDFDSVVDYYDKQKKLAEKLGKKINLKSSSYKSHTKLKLSGDSIDKLTNKHISSFEKELKKLYGSTKFEKFPSEVRLALFDMIFNLGMTKLKNNFPNFNKHIKANDWSKAAKESHRTDVSKERNDYVKSKLNKASQSAKAKKVASDLKAKKESKIIK